MGKEQDIHREAQEAVMDERRRAREREGDEGTPEDAAASAGPGDIAAQSPVPPSEETAAGLAEAQARAEQYWSELLRARAEIANIQRRAERDIENAYKYSLEKFAGELIPVIDSLERGLEAAAEGSASDLQKIREGMDLTLRLMNAAVAKVGLKTVDPQGERFDPALHQAMSVQAAPGVEANRVVAVYQKGYTLNDRLIRPAMVVVSGPGGPASGDGTDGSPGGKGFDATA
jgi:molecular chaperone GrpE